MVRRAGMAAVPACGVPEAVSPSVASRACSRRAAQGAGEPLCGKPPPRPVCGSRLPRSPGGARGVKTRSRHAARQCSRDSAVRVMVTTTSAAMQICGMQRDSQGRFHRANAAALRIHAVRYGPCMAAAGLQPALLDCGRFTDRGMASWPCEFTAAVVPAGTVRWDTLLGQLLANRATTGRRSCRLPSTRRKPCAVSSSRTWWGVAPGRSGTGRMSRSTRRRKPQISSLLGRFDSCMSRSTRRRKRRSAAHYGDSGWSAWTAGRRRGAWR